MRRLIVAQTQSLPRWIFCHGDSLRQLQISVNLSNEVRPSVFRNATCRSYT